MAPRKTAPKSKSTKAAKVVYPRAQPQAGLSQADIDNGEWNVEGLVGKRFLDDMLQYRVRWEGPWDGPPGSYEEKEKWENAGDISGFLIMRYEKDADGAAWPGPVPEFPRVTTATTAARPAGVKKPTVKARSTLKAKTKAKRAGAVERSLKAVESSEESDSDSEPESESESESESGSEYEPESEDSDSEAESDVQIKTEPESELEAEVKAEVEEVEESSKEEDYESEPETEGTASGSESEAKVKLADVEALFDLEAKEVDASSEEAEAEAEVVVEQWRPEYDLNYDSLDDAEAATDEKL
jgi:hypothetical protein